MKKLIVLLLICITIPLLFFGQQEIRTADGRKVVLHADGTWQYADSLQANVNIAHIAGLEIPALNHGDEVVRHTGYSIVYSESHEQAEWVAYELTKAETAKVTERSNKFIPDPAIKTGSATNRDYEKSGYDRGHLAPAADMGWSETTMNESFYYSNMSPQVPAFNRGIWKKLEELVRSWAIENEAVYVVTGPVLRPGLPSIGPNGVSVPEYYYKVILDYTEPDIKGIGFILLNEGSTVSLQQFAVTIDSVERFTGIDFFPAVPDNQENLIEKEVCLKCWSWAGSKSGKDMGIKASSSVQCNGLTKAGNRCRNKTLNPEGYCYLHIGQKSPGEETISNANGLLAEEQTTDRQTGTNSKGQAVYTGPRGGQYHYSKSGEKVYERKHK